VTRTGSTTPRVRAPELRGRAWLNTGGRTLTLADLRGKIVLLDFWTFCCVNCLHVLDELRPLEDRYADVLVTIGVHSPKFEHEKDPDAVAAAVERYGVAHPVLDDPAMRMWQEYTAKAWPTLTVIDPEGYVVASMAGEGHADGLARLFDELITTHEAKGTLRRGGALTVPVNETPTALRFPGKAAVLEGGTFLVADSAHHSLVELAADGETEIRRIGGGPRGRSDGAPEAARFSEPGGVCVLPPRVAELAGYDVVVADTVNHLLRGVRLDTGEVRTVAGSGRQWRGTVDFDTHDALAVDLSSPWDVAYFDGRVIVAMAGIHQLWFFDPVTRTAGVYAGTTVEALRDGPLHEAWLAQPSGLSTSPDGTRLWIADSESSALRWVAGGELHTAVGQGLFDFGHVDGPATEALLQHPLGVLALADGAVLVADTYNGAVRRYDPATRTVTTVAAGLAEPSDLVVTPTGDVFVVESAAHRLTRLDPSAERITGPRRRTERPVTDLAAGEMTLDVVFTPAPGQKLDDSFGPPTRLLVSASPPELLVEGAGDGTELSRHLVISDAVPSGVLQVVAQAATCDADAANPACHLSRQDWGVPVRVAPDGATRLSLVLRGPSPLQDRADHGEVRVIGDQSCRTSP
jgi:thiol-disulfide isomerase/thioredoxin/sugar lactone lactonase YvrE